MILVGFTTGVHSSGEIYYQYSLTTLVKYSASVHDIGEIYYQYSRYWCVILPVFIILVKCTSVVDDTDDIY